MKIMMFVMCVMLNLANINTPTYYARVSNNAYLYSQKNVSSALFVLPESYYVKLTSDCGEYYKVRYDNLSGYVKKDSVTPVIGKPKTPFLSGASFRVFTSDGATLRTTPTKNSTITTTLPINKEIRYYGSIVGDEVYLCFDVRYRACADDVDGASASIKIVEKDADGKDDPVATLSAVVSGGKIKCQWQVTYTADEDDADSQQELAEKGYTLPEYAFVVECGVVESGESGESGVLEVR